MKNFESIILPGWKMMAIHWWIIGAYLLCLCKHRPGRHPISCVVMKFEEDFIAWFSKIIEGNDF